LKILILGYSNLFRKRILDVFLKEKIKFSIASKSKAQKDIKAYKWFRDYNIALRKSDANVVYISLSNSLHYKWAKKALEKNFHVIVDKPIALKFKDILTLLKLAKKKKVLLAEATFFNYHCQFIKALKLIKNKKNINYINTNFIIPTPLKNSFRMKKKSGGGCLHDMSAYAAATARLLSSGKLLSFQSNIFKNDKGLVTSFSVSCKFQKNYYFGYFCFGGEYKNNMILYSKEKYIELNNVFSPPSDKQLKILIKNKNQLRVEKTSKDNVFRNYFYEIKKSLQDNKFQSFYDKILIDAKFKNKLK